jgi:hypothetical protein
VTGGIGDLFQVLYSIENDIQAYERYYNFYKDTFLSTNNKIIHNRNIEYRFKISNILDTISSRSINISDMLQRMVKIGFDVVEPQQYQELVDLNEVVKNNKSFLQMQKTEHDIMSQELFEMRLVIDNECHNNVSCFKSHSILKNSHFFERDSIQTQKTFDSVKYFQGNLNYLRNNMID